MRHFLPLTLAAIAVSTAASAANAPRASDAPATLSPKLSEALKGRTAGEPTNCISLSRSYASEVVDEQAVIYKESRKRWFVNYPARGDCSSLKYDRTLITRTPSNRLCSGDLVRVVDIVARPAIEYGSCALGNFTPYTLP